jgi:methyl-accepting chemotaxis protein
MDWKDAFFIVLPIAVAGLTLWNNALKDQIRNMRDDFNREVANVKHDVKNVQQSMANFREMVPMTYATINDLNRSVDQINDRIGDAFGVLNQINEKIDRLKDSK